MFLDKYFVISFIPCQINFGNIFIASAIIAIIAIAAMIFAHIGKIEKMSSIISSILFSFGCLYFFLMPFNLQKKLILF